MTIEKNCPKKIKVTSEKIFNEYVIVFKKGKNMKQITNKYNWNNFSVENWKHDIRLVAKREGLIEEPCSKSAGSIQTGEIKQEFDNHIHKNTEGLRHHFEDIEKEQNKPSHFLKKIIFNLLLII